MVVIPSQPVLNPILVEPSSVKSITAVEPKEKPKAKLKEELKEEPKEEPKEELQEEPKEESKEKPWMFIVLIGLALLGLLGFVGWKFGAATWIQQLTRGQQFRPSTSSSTNRGTIARSTLSTNFDENIFHPQSVEPPPPDIPDTLQRIKVRSQQVRIGPLDEDEI